MARPSSPARWHATHPAALKSPGPRFASAAARSGSTCATVVGESTAFSVVAVTFDSRLR